MKWYIKVLSNNNSFPTERVGCTGNIDLKLGLHGLSKVGSIQKQKQLSLWQSAYIWNISF